LWRSVGRTFQTIHPAPAKLEAGDPYRSAGPFSARGSLPETEASQRLVEAATVLIAARGAESNSEIAQESEPAARNRQFAIDGGGRLGEDSERMHESERSPAKRQRSGSRLTPHGWLPVVLGWSLSVNCSQAAPVAQPAFECFPVSDLERVFEDGYGPLERGTRRHRVPPGGGGLQPGGNHQNSLGRG